MVVVDSIVVIVAGVAAAVGVALFVEVLDGC